LIRVSGAFESWRVGAYNYWVEQGASSKHDGNR
jgi:hypothetical protein